MARTKKRSTKKAAAKKSGRLSSLERTLLYLPMVGGLVFGALPFLLGSAFGKIVGYAGNDTFIYRIAGAATLGYGVALFLGLRKADWAPLRLVVLATLVFNIASIFACLVEIFGSSTTLFAYVILGASSLFVVITTWVLNQHQGGASPRADVSKGTINILWLGFVLSGLFGVLPLLVPVLFAQLVGFMGTDVGVIRQAGAASLGYAVMAFYAIRSGAWVELRLPVIMAMVFNGFSFIASVLGLLAGDPVLIVAVIGAASLLMTVLAPGILRRKGK